MKQQLSLTTSTETVSITTENPSALSQKDRTANLSPAQIAGISAASLAVVVIVIGIGVLLGYYYVLCVLIGVENSKRKRM